MGFVFFFFSFIDCCFLNEIINKINFGKISEERLDASVLRILAVKYMRGIMKVEE